MDRTNMRKIPLQMLSIFLLTTVSSVVSIPAQPLEGDRTYEGFQVYRLTAEHDPQTLMETLGPLEQQSMVDVWSHGSRSADVVVAPEHISYVRKRLADRGIRSDVIVEDLQSELHRDFVKRQRHKRSVPDVTRDYLKFEEMWDYLRQVERDATNVQVTVGNIGLSFESRTVPVIEIRQRTSNPQPKKAFLIDAGIHAREWIAPAMAMNIIRKLAFDNDRETREMLEMFDWIIVPCVNPDGYVFSHNSVDSRMWRKTRTTRYDNNPQCYGVDGNRNFAYDWNPEIGGSRDHCQNVYSGPYAFSEPETRNIRDWMNQHRGRAVAYVTMHSYGEYILYPYGSDGNKHVDDLNLMKSLATSFSRELLKTGHRYTVGNSARSLYPAAGGSDDYAKGTVNITVSYTLELSPASGNPGFLLDKSNINKVIEDTWPGFKVMARELYKALQTRQSSSSLAPSPGSNSANTHSHGGDGGTKVKFSMAEYLSQCCERNRMSWCCYALSRNLSSG